jgi:hypothetical protein
MGKCVSDIYDRQYHNTDLDGEGLGALSRLPPVDCFFFPAEQEASGELTVVIPGAQGLATSGKRNLLRHTTDYYRALRSTL